MYKKIITKIAQQCMKKEKNFETIAKK